VSLYPLDSDRLNEIPVHRRFTVHFDVLNLESCVVTFYAMFSNLRSRVLFQLCAETVFIWRVVAVVALANLSAWNAVQQSEFTHDNLEWAIRLYQAIRGISTERASYATNAIAQCALKQGGLWTARKDMLMCLMAATHFQSPYVVVPIGQYKCRFL